MMKYVLKSLILTLSLIICLSGCTGISESINQMQMHNNDNIPNKPGLVLEEFVFTAAPFPSCHAATIEEVDGELICSFFGGTAERNPDVCIWVSRKINGKWTSPVKVADGVTPQQRYPTWNPVLFSPKGSDLMLFYKVGPSPKQWWGMITTSSDGGKNWTTAVPLLDENGNTLIGPVKNKPIQLLDGTILAPSSREDIGWCAHIESSCDSGKTWNTLTGPLNDPEKFHAIQPTLLTYHDGRVQMLCRSQEGKILETWSRDKGKHFSAMRPTTLPNPNSGIDAVTLSDGRQLLVYNHSTRNQPQMGHKGRGILNVALSTDGINWNAALILDYEDSPGRQFSYPSVIQTSDGLVHIVYTWHRERIKHVVLDPDKLQTVPMPGGKWPDTIRP